MGIDQLCTVLRIPDMLHKLAHSVVFSVSLDDTALC